MNDTENPQPHTNTPAASTDFSLPSEMFRAVDKEPEKTTISMWKIGDDGKIKTEDSEGYNVL